MCTKLSSSKSKSTNTCIQQMEEEKANNLDDDSEAQAIAKQDPFTAKPLKGESI